MRGAAPVMGLGWRRLHREANLVRALSRRVGAIVGFERRRRYLRRQLGEAGEDSRRLEDMLTLLCAAFRDHAAERGARRDVVRCSFCHKDEYEVDDIVAASTAAICSGCADAVVASIDEARRRRA